MRKPIRGSEAFVGITLQDAFEGQRGQVLDDGTFGERHNPASPVVETG
jgi:hypothetical protein